MTERDSIREALKSDAELARHEAVSDDWQVVEEALHYALLRVGRQLGWQEAADTYKDGKAALARLREREAQQRAQDEKVILKRGQEIDKQLRRAEAAEARVAELEGRAWDRLAAKEVKRLEARVAELEEALREIAEARMYAGTATYEPSPEEFTPTYGALAAERARRALAHKEETP